MKNFINIRESSSEYGKSLRKIANDKKLKSISTKDKQSLSKIADMLAKANEGAEKYTVQQGKMQRKVDGKTADKMKKQGWKLIATEEVQEEGLDHQFFYSVGSGLDVATEYTSFDSAGNPLGLNFVLNTGVASSGELTFTLRHEPNKPNSGLDNAGGETDIEVTFNLTVE